MELVIEYLIVFALGWFIGSRITGFFQLQVFKQILIDLKIDNKDLIRVARKGAPEIIQQQLDQLESHVDAAELDQIDIKVEKHNDTLYAYRNDTNEFLEQGSSKDALIEAMAHRVKNVRLTVVEGNEHMTA